MCNHRRKFTFHAINIIVMELKPKFFKTKQKIVTLLFDISKEPILFSIPTTPNVHILLEENKKHE